MADADVAGRAAASLVTMVTRRNLYAVGMGRLVGFYWREFETFSRGNSRGAEGEIAFLADASNSFFGRHRTMFPSAGAGSCQCWNSNSQRVAAPVSWGKSLPSP